MLSVLPGPLLIVVQAVCSPTLEGIPLTFLIIPYLLGRYGNFQADDNKVTGG